MWPVRLRAAHGRRAYGPTTFTTPLPPLFIADYESQLCGSHEHIYNAGAKYTGAIYTGTPTSCSTYTPSGDMYRVGTEVPPAMFSTVTVQNDP